MSMNYVLDGLPETVKVGPYFYRVDVVDALKSQSDMAWGVCDNSRHILQFQQEWPGPQKAVDTVIHECLHAIYHTWDIPDPTVEEDCVSRMATALTCLLHDNPHLAAWIVETVAL